MVQQLFIVDTKRALLVRVREQKKIIFFFAQPPLPDQLVDLPDDQLAILPDDQLVILPQEVVLFPQPPIFLGGELFTIRINVQL